MIYGTFVDEFTKVLSIIIPLVTTFTAITEFMDRLSARSSSYRWALRGKKLVAAKHLDILRRNNLTDNDLKTQRLMSLLSQDSLVEVIESYVADKCSRVTSPMVKQLRYLCVNSLVVTLLLYALPYLNRLVSNEQFNRNISILVPLVVVYGIFILWHVLQAIVAFVCRAFYLVQSTRIMASRSVALIALSKVRSYVITGERFVFVDATLRSRAEVIGRPTINGSDSLFEFSDINDEKVVLVKTEYQQSRQEDYEDLVARTVESYVKNRFDKDRNVVCFVYSEFGISAGEVTYAFKNIGITAYCIGKSDGCERELSRTVAEIVLLRECGLV